MTVDELPGYLKEHWPAIREQLIGGIYKPQAVKRVEIPKPDGGVRALKRRPMAFLSPDK
jgi:RNA-directed DNA polymerase